VQPSRAQQAFGRSCIRLQTSHTHRDGAKSGYCWHRSILHLDKRQTLQHCTNCSSLLLHVTDRQFGLDTFSPKHEHLVNIIGVDFYQLDLQIIGSEDLACCIRPGQDDSYRLPQQSSESAQGSAPDTLEYCPVQQGEHPVDPATSQARVTFGSCSGSDSAFATEGMSSARNYLSGELSRAALFSAALAQCREFDSLQRT
jgi:hypothetical protein